MASRWLTLALGLLAGALLGVWLSRLRRRRRLRRARLRGRAGELQARELLQAAGYTVTAEQPTLRCALYVDGAPRPYELRGDFLVRRGGRTLLAEVKTGRQAPDPCHPATRRQLLEYASSYGVDGVLLVDMERREIHDVAWDLPRAPGGGRLAWLLLGAAAGALASWAALQHLP